MRLIVRYEKNDDVKYISHLDMMRTFQRILRRSGLPVKYSSGFNIHMNISFAIATSVGITSSAEYVDIQLAQDVNASQALAALNENTCRGIKMTSAITAEDTYPSLMGKVALSEYVISSDFISSLSEADLASFAGLDSVNIMKRSKSGTKETDILPLIIDQQLKDGCLYVKLAAGSSQNLNPSLYYQALETHFSGAGAMPEIRRTALYDEKGRDMFSLEKE